MALPLLALAAATPAAAVPTTNWLDYTIIAQDRLNIGPNLNLAGNYAVTNIGGSLELALDDFQLDDTPPPFMVGDTITLAGQVSIVDAYTNLINAAPSAEIRGQVFPETFPVLLSMPPFPSAAVCAFCSVTAADVVVQPDQTTTLTPGCYGELFARSNATVFLEPGSYTFREWDIQKFASVTANGPVQIHIRNKVATEEGNFLGATSGNVLDYQVWIGSRKSCNSLTNPTPSNIGKFSIVIGTFVAPEDDDFNFNKGVILMGTAVAKEVDVRGQHEMRPPTPTPTPVHTPTPTPPVHTPTPTPPVHTPTPTPPVHTPTPTPPVHTPTPTPPVHTPTPTPPVHTPTPTPPVHTPTPTPPVHTPTPTPPVHTPTPTPPVHTPTPTPPVQTPTPTPNLPTPTPTQPFTPPTPTPTVLPTPTPTQPFVPPTPTPLPTATAVPRKHPWGKKSGLIDSLFPQRTGSRIAPSMRRPLGVRR